MKNGKSNFEIENELDKLYFENLLKKVKGKSKQLEKLIGIQADLFNILWLYRCTKYFEMQKKDYLIPYQYRIGTGLLEKLKNCYRFEEIQTVLGETIYRDVLKEEIEYDIKRYLYQLYQKTFRENTQDISFIISYFELEEIGKNNIITIIEGIRYGLEGEKLRKKII